MARYRTVKADLWKHPAIRRAPLHVGWLWAYLITAKADDEGRFVADAYMIGDDAFSHDHNIDEKQVGEDLLYLSKSGLLLLYGVGTKRFGFLTGWYEHQYIQSDRRQSSSLPPPPCDIHSWECADEVRARCAEERGQSIKFVTYSEALRWNQQQSFEFEGETPPAPEVKGDIGLQEANETVTKRTPEGEGEGEVEREVEGEGKKPPPTLFDQCEQVLSIFTDGGAKLEQILMGCVDIHPRAKDVLLQECTSLAARHIDGDDVKLGWLSRNVSDAVRKLESEHMKGVPGSIAEDTSLRAHQAKLDAEAAERERIIAEEQAREA